MAVDQRFTFDFNWKLSLSVLFVFPMLVKLSFWQVDRAEEKSAIAASWKARQSAAPLAFADIPKDDAPPFQRAFAEGQFLPEKYWLKENQIYNGKIGYNVIMPFETSEGDVLVVDRGWIEGSPMREFVPEVPTPREPLRITGTLIVPTDSKLIREAETSVKSWPHKVLETDIAVMRSQSNLDLYARVLKVDADNPAALDVFWRPINMSPTKHYGYAVQWALMAIALLVLYVFASSNLGALIKARKSRR